jgi:hypothetical protein
MCPVFAVLITTLHPTGYFKPDTCNSKKKSQKGKENQSQKPGTSYIYIDSDSTDPETDDDDHEILHVYLEEVKCCVCKPVFAVLITTLHPTGYFKP